MGIRVYWSSIFTLILGLQEAASRSQVDTEWKLFNALMDVGKTSTVYQELRVNASLLRQGTHKAGTSSMNCIIASFFVKF